MFFSASGHPVSSIAARSANIYADVPANLWFSVYVNQAKNMKLVSLESDGRFHADWALTRGQIAEIIYRYLYIKEKKLPMFDPSLNWNVYDQASLFLKMKYADDMKIVKTGLMETVFASSNSLANFERILPDSAYLQVKISDNFEHDKYKFYDNLNNYAKTLSDVKLREINKNGISGFLINGSVGQYSILDVYFFLPNNKMISFMGSYGHGFLQEELKEKIYLMATSFEFQASGGGIEKIVSDAREKIWVEGAGKKVLESFPEKLLIIETDSIGTGSGPVDYYYSSLGNVSIKYQRSNDMVLGIKEGKTSTF
ncbi:hypothetical protein A2483_04085 [Candidatus Peregrinibacteria bacterium RIFOXYC2_FULL_33_13]|nr:MAG: hypothetical protein A2483_04085 [Candidatus Peregrinibacteria bacterium RIFOXYC2_FULL_33_13]